MPLEPTTSEDYRGKTVKVCHKTVQISTVNRQSYQGEAELAGVVQNVLLSPEYVHERVDLDEE